MTYQNSSPWPDVAAARPFLAYLAALREDAPSLPLDAPWQEKLAAWLVLHDVAALAAVRCRAPYPALARRLAPQLYDTAAENSLHWENLRQIDAQFAERGLPAVLLKGAALAETVYDGPAQRAMADVDLWVEAADFAEACAVVAGLDFYAAENANRPLALQALSGGEIQFYRRQGVSTLVELHLSPFEGWWLKRTAAVNEQQIWARKQPLDAWLSFYHLVPEDMIIHLAVHLAVGHQFGVQSVRALLDIGRLTGVVEVDWSVVAQRACEWRVATTVWLVLFHAQMLVGLPIPQEAMRRIEPSARHRRRLLGMVPPQSILDGAERHGERERQLLLLSMVDRRRDGARLIMRTLWPEKEWLRARYGAGSGHWRHWKHLIRERRV